MEAVNPRRWWDRRIHLHMELTGVFTPVRRCGYIITVARYSSLESSQNLISVRSSGEEARLRRDA
jgi:hypothetical protein